MRLSLSTTLALLPFFVAALPHDTRRSIPISKHASLNNLDGTVNIDALRRHLEFVKGKIRRGNAAYEANTGLRLAVEEPAALRLREDPASDPLVNHNALLWYGTISVGTPPIEYKVDFDTGSSDIFLPGANCKANCDGHTLYDPSKSRTSKPLKKSFTLKYGDGSTVSGMQFKDTVTVAGLTANNQTLGSATQYSTGFSADNFPADGLMGMAYQSISSYRAPPFFQTLVSQRKASQPVFAFKLAKEGSELTLGGLNSAIYRGEFTYVPVTRKAYWMVKMDSMNVGDTPVVNESDAIIDTGTTLIIGEPSKVADFYNAIPGSKDASSTLGSGIYTVPCNSIPDLSLSFGGKTFSVSKETFSLGPAADGSEDCVGGVASADVASIGWIVGDSFLQNVYTAFDLGGDQVGFAELA